jgi:glycosyltransferase involved in cell wall biosynthesis
MFQFHNKTVFIISPEKWGIMKVSKHHYAMELAKAGANVFFIEPPSLQQKGVQVTVCSEHKNIHIIKYKPVFRAKRFLPDFLYKILLRKQVALIKKAAGVTPDLLFCFQGYLFQNLRWFHAANTVFFAVDQFNEDELPQEAETADLLLAISDTIKEKLAKSGKTVVQMNHGLQESFVNMAEEIIQRTLQVKPAETIKAGYVGNLRMQALNRKMMMKIIFENPDVKFIFWGSYRSHELNLGGQHNADADTFIHFLEKTPNVELRGVVNGNILSDQIKECNLFWLCWETGEYRLWDGSNSHKILEYMATGAPVVAHHVSAYAQTNLLHMLKRGDDVNQYPDLFSAAKSLLKQGEPLPQIHKRLQFAVDNSYSKQLEKIASLLS